MMLSLTAGNGVGGGKYNQKIVKQDALWTWTPNKDCKIVYD